jgi:hypothetical protein
VTKEWLAAEISRFLLKAESRPLTRYSAASRTVIRSERYRSFESGQKQNVPDPSATAFEDLAEEAAVFGRQVDSATKFHDAAGHYLRQVLITDQGLRREIAYRAVHGSHKIYWLREHIFRWVGVLAHYIPGVEPEYLPAPSTPSPKLDLLHYHPPSESCYAAMALVAHGFKPSWSLPLLAVLGREFTGQDETALLQVTLVLAGWSALLRDIAVAQVRVMTWALNPNAPNFAAGLPRRRLHRAIGTYCDFWHLRLLRERQGVLRGVADGVLQGHKPPGTPAAIPPFHQFVPEPRLTPETEKRNEQS